MQNAKVATENAFFLIIGNVLHKAVAILFFAILARHIGPKQFGVFSLAQVLAGVMLPLSNPGVSKIIYLDAAVDGKSLPYLAGGGALLRGLFLFVGFGCLVALSYAMGYPTETSRIVLIVGLAVFIMDIAQNYYSIFRATSNSRLEMYSQVFRSILLSVIVIILLSSDIGLTGLSFLYLGKSVLVVIMLVVTAFLVGIPHKLPKAKFTMDLLRRGAPLGLQGLMVLVYLYADSLMLSEMKSTEALGFYQAAYRLVSSLNIFAIAFTSSIFPMLVKQHTGDNKERFGDIYYRSIKYLLLMGFGIATGTTLLGEKIITLFYGSEFSSSVILLQILIWAEALIFLGFALTNIFLAQDKRWILSAQATAAAVVNIVLNIPAIYYWGAPGAALTTLITEAFVVYFLLLQLNKAGIHLSKRWLKDFILISTSCLVMGAVLLLGRSIPFPLLVILGTLTYFTALFLFKFFDDVDVRLARQMLDSVMSKIQEST